MRALIQRVANASVTVDGTPIAQIGAGLLILLGITTGDTREEAERLAAKIARLRIFADEALAMNRSLLDTGGEALVVSQFTLYAATRKGNRPSFVAAARPEEAEPLYRFFIDRLREELGRPVATGRFGADMQVALTNDGPVTIAIDTRAWE